MKRIITLFVAISLIFSLGLNLTSCDREYDEAEVKAAAEVLIEKSLFLNDIYWGKGIPYTPGLSSSLYCEADFIALSVLGFTTVDELKTKTEEVFSENYCADIYSTSFSSIKDGEEIQFYARYYQKYEDEFQTEPICIMVYSRFENMIPDKVEYLYDTLTVTHSEGETVYVKIQANVTRDEEHSQIREMLIGLVEEENGWRIDTPTYLKYNDRQEEYEDLQDKKNK